MGEARYSKGPAFVAASVWRGGVLAGRAVSVPDLRVAGAGVSTAGGESDVCGAVLAVWVALTVVLTFVVPRVQAPHAHT